MSSNVLSSVGRLALTAAGTYFGGPIGGVIGGALGQATFPGSLPDQFGPRLGPDQPVTSSVIGQTIPIIYGTIDVQGNVIQDLGRVEIATTESQGKGGPSQDVTTYTYTRTYAVMLCEGPISGVLRIWRNAKLVYDIRPQQAGESDADFQIRQAESDGFAERFALYLGTSSQTADPILEADVGVGNQPAYRGRAYIVFYDEDVTDNGGRTSSWKFEVVDDGVFVSSDDTEYAVPVLYDWLEATDPRDDRNIYRYSYDPSGATPRQYYDTLAEAISAAETDTGRSYSNQYLIGWELLSTVPIYPYSTITGYEDKPVLDIHVNDYEPVKGLDGVITHVTNEFISLAAAGVESNEIFWWSGLTTTTNYNPSGFAGGVWTVSQSNPGAGWSVINNCIFEASCPAFWPGSVTSLRAYPDAVIGVARYPGAPGNPCDGYPALPSNTDFCVLPNGDIERDQEWARSEIADGYLCIRPYLYESSDSIYTGADLDPDDYPVGPIRPIGHEDDTQAFWEAAEAASVLAGTSPSGRTYVEGGVTFANRDTGFPVITSVAYTRPTNSSQGTPNEVTLASIVTDICARVGIDSSDIEVSDLTETVKGYRIDRPMTGRQAIEPLQLYGYFDVVDGAGLKFPTRGKASVATLDADTLSAHDAGGNVPPLLQLTRTEDVELPQYIGVKYIMPHADYAVGIQESQRQIVNVVGKQYLEAPIAMSDDKAKQMTEVALAGAWISREDYRISVSPRWLALEAGDAITLPIDGESQRAVIQSIQGAYPGPLAIECKRDDQSIYLSTAAGVASGITPQTIAFAGFTVYDIIDATALNSAADDAGFYLALYGTGDEWPGASLYESTDGGTTFNFVDAFNVGSTMGTLDSALPAGPYSIWDETNTLEVTLGNGTLESRTEAAVLNGANAAFIGADGRWELIQFRTATLTSSGSYELTGLLRGRRGTESFIGQSVAGDTFVLCTTLYRVPKDSNVIGLSRQYKMVTSRTFLESAPAESVTLDGVALECYAPARVTGVRDESENLTIQVYRRSRLGPEWKDYADVPLNEESEAYQIDIRNGSTVVRTLSVTGSNTLTYTAAQQTTDFGSAQASIDMVVYQMSATVGRGYELEATL